MWTPKVFGDRVRLEQVASNLISNAVKFTPDGGVVDVRMRRVGDHAELVLSDSGQGIPVEFLPSVFELFRQADGSTTRMHSGLGLGLSIVKSLVEAHNGTVQVHSAGEGMGATFVVTLPAAVWERSARRQAPATRNQPAMFHRWRGSACSSSMTTKKAGTWWRHTCTGATRPCRRPLQRRMASTLLQREHVDVLLADIGMPGEDGYSLIRRVRALARPAARRFRRPRSRPLRVKRIASGRSSAGFQLHLTKPIDASALVAAVAALHTRTSA